MQNDVKDTPVAIKMRTPSSLIAAALHRLLMEHIKRKEHSIFSIIFFCVIFLV